MFLSKFPVACQTRWWKRQWSIVHWYIDHRTDDFIPNLFLRRCGHPLCKTWIQKMSIWTKAFSHFLTCCASKRQQVRAPHRKLLTKVHVGLKGHWGYEKNWEWWAASPTRRARAGLQSRKIGPFWEAVAIFPLFLWGRNLWPHISTYLAYWNQLKNL